MEERSAAGSARRPDRVMIFQIGVEGQVRSLNLAVPTGSTPPLALRNFER